METKVFTLELMGGEKLMEKSPGTGQRRSLDEILTDGWVPMHWDNISLEHFIRYRVVMARKT